MTRPDDIPVKLWDYVLFEVVPNDLTGSVLGRRVQENTCRAIMKATAEAYDDAVKIVEARTEMFSTDEGLQGRNALKEAASSIRYQAIRQHSQKGKSE